MKPGIETATAVRPQWTRLEPAGRRVPLAGRWLLHAGPPYRDASEVPAPVRASAALACVHEGWAATPEAGDRLVRDGAVALLPAQDHGCVTPLAAVVSPRTTVLVCEDAAGAVAPACAPLGTIGGVDLRFGTRDAAILPRLAQRDGEHAALLAVALDEPVDLLAIAAAALRAGDDLHNRTNAASAALADVLLARLRATRAAAATTLDALAAGLAATPLFFLTFWMAAAKLMLHGLEGGPASLVTRIGGNGTAFGIAVAGAPGVWHTVPADPPQGPRLPNASATATALGAIGDSAVIDAAGFGGQALHCAPEASGPLAAWLPPESETTAAALFAAPHPAFSGSGIHIGLDAARVAASGRVPLVTLAMLDREGRAGLLGRGIYQPPAALFAAAADTPQGGDQA